MPDYLVTTQTAQTDRRTSRSSKTAARECVTVNAATIAGAAGLAISQASTDVRVVSIEEVYADFPTYTDDQLTELLTTGAGADGIDKQAWEEMYAGKNLWMEDDFETYIVGGIVTALNNAAFPGLSYSPVANDDRTVDFLMVEVYDEATRSYRATGVSSKHLRNYEETGWSAVLSVARNLLYFVQSHNLA